jgi:alpha,alpha-trehalose-phosphate synthase [UDP-forming]
LRHNDLPRFLEVTLARASKLVVVANRLPISRDKAGEWISSTGGLVTALVPILQKRGGAWIGWSGDSGRGGRLPSVDGVAMRSVGLTEKEIDTYYNGFSNRTLWPLYHDAIREPEFNHDWWPAYEAVNEKFARAAAAATGANDTVWVHDYHLQLVPEMLRELRPDLKIGFFLHIPFPPEELFSWLPWRERILRGMLGADLVGFQTHSEAQNFSRAARRYTDADGTDTELRYKDQRVRVNSFPISIDFDWFEQRASEAEVRTQADLVRRRLGSRRKILLCVDRLDYTKGIDTRLVAFELMLKRRRASVENCVLVQIAAPSREPVFEYAEMRTRIEQLVGRINGEYSEPGRVAVHYFRRGFTREQLLPYYCAADVMVVTPLRDGMNLVCKEYVATRTEHTGVLVLSEFAGAARQMRRSLLVNPRDVEGMAATMELALGLPVPEARQRMAILRTMVRRHDVHEWAEQYLEALQG